MKNKTIKFRIYLLVALTVLLGGALTVMSLNKLNWAKKTSGELLLTELLDGQKERLKLATDSMAETLALTIKDAENSQEEKEILFEYVRDLRYEDDESGYYFIYEGTILAAHPIIYDLHGEDLGDRTDSQGRYFVKMLDETARSGGGFVRYSHLKPGKGEEEKLSYATMIPGTDYYIGTGIYITNLDELRQAAQEEMVAALSDKKKIQVVAGVFLILVMLVFSEMIARSITRPLKVLISDLTTGAEEINEGTAQVSNSSQTLAEGASDQASSLEESSASMEEITSMVARNEEVAQHTAESATEANESAKQGVSAMKSLRAGVESVSSSAKEMESAMGAIKESSDSVSKIIKTIDEIAFQTNILALNAAVEAARAGEAGAGFAVVADEVRNLAGRAAEAAQETSKLIEDSVTRSDRGVAVNAQVGQHLGEVLEQAGEVEGRLTSITSRVTEVSSAMGEITASVQEQNSGIGEVNRTISHISELTQGTAASSEEAAAAADQIHGQAQSLLSAITVLTNMVEGQNAKAKSSGALQLPDQEKLALRAS